MSYDGTPIKIEQFNADLQRAMRKAGITAELRAVVETHMSDWCNYPSIAFPETTPPEILDRALAFAYTWVTRHSSYVYRVREFIRSAKDEDRWREMIAFACYSIGD